jgi:hypothetical protein
MIYGAFHEHITQTKALNLAWRGELQMVIERDRERKLPVTKMATQNMSIMVSKRTRFIHTHRNSGENRLGLAV